MIKGISVILYTQTQSGTDPFNEPIYQESPTTIDNVLVAPATSQEVIDNLKMYGKKAVYTLGIPKSDNHDWKDKHIEFFGQKFKSFGIPTKGIDDLIPLDWNTKVMVERYE